ncbi:MAG: sugar transferase [Pseudonocardiaceae bacterium]
MKARRGVERAVAVVTMIASSPLCAASALAVRITMGRPVLFRELRAGQGGKPFVLVKFRTMRPIEPGEDGPESDGRRITRVGRFLRSTSLDELPTLWNVVVGDMVFVGPRPLPVRYLDRYSSDHARRHEVKPGITGLAQVKGRNQLSWQEKFDHDVWYVDHRSLWLDLTILGRTAVQVVKRVGISRSGHATMPEFGEG